MTSNMDVAVKEKNSAPGLCFLLLAAVWGCVAFIPESVFLVIPALLVFSLIYFIYYLSSEGHLAGILKGVVISVILMAIAGAIPIIGWLILLGWIVYNIAKAFESIRTLLPEALLSLVLVACLIVPIFDDLNHYGDRSLALTIGCGIAYFFAAAVACSRIHDRSDSPKQSLFLFSLMVLSVPMIVLLLASIVASLRAAFRMALVNNTSVVNTSQRVSGYTTAKGTVVDSYTRIVPKTVSNTVTQVLPGAGAVGASLTGSLGEAVAGHGGNQNSEASGLILAGKNDDDFATHKDHHFYRYDGMDEKKLANFIDAVNKTEGFARLCKEEVMFYFDETLFGRGDQGLVLTHQRCYCLAGKFDTSFQVELTDIEKVSLKGKFNKHLVIQLKAGRVHEVILTQSNAGAEKMYELLRQTLSDIKSS